MALKGINYGHHLLATAYNPQTVVSELQMLYNNGYRLLRVAYPTYNSSSGTLNMLKDVVVKGLDCGFTVIWGVVGNRPTITSSNYSTFSSYVTGTLAPWAQALNNPKLRLSIGNEEELHVDGTTMTIATLQSNLKSLATSVQSVYTVGEVNYVTDAEQWTLWNTLGLGDIDKIGFNLYYEWQPTGSYATKLAAINTAFTTRYFIGEYSTSNGFADASAFGAATAEDNWAQNIAQRKTIADSYNLDHCVFCFGDGQFGVTANSWALRKTDGTFRKAWYAHSGSRAYGTKTVSPAGAITISAPSGVNTGDQTLSLAGTSLTISGANGNSVTLPTPSGGTWGSITGTLSSQTDLQTALSAKAASSSLSTVATSGSYTDLINKPTIPTVSDASTSTKGIVQLAGDLAGTATAPTVPGLATKLTGPGSSVSGNIATFNSTTGLTVADSGVSASDLSTSISTLNTSKEPIITAGTSGQYWDGTKTWQTLNKAAVGLASANDTSDANKPVSTAQQAALDLKADSVSTLHTTGDETKTGGLTIDGSNGSKELYLKSSFNGQDDTGVAGHYDSTSRLHLESFQRAGTNNYGEVVHVDEQKWQSKQMIAWRMPDAYDSNGDPIGALNSKVWMGAHSQATGGDSNHNHWEIETHDSKGLMRGRFTVDFAATTSVDGAASSNDPASVGIGLDKTYVATNQADFIVRTNYPTFAAGDTTVPTGPKLASAMRLTGSAGIAQDIQFAHDFYGADRRWALRNSADIESIVLTITGSPTGGTFTLTVNGQTTAAIAYNETASNVQAALTALSTVVSGCTVVGSAGGPYTVSFAVNTPAWTKSITPNGAGLTGGTTPTITASKPNTGSNFQINAYDDGGTILGTVLQIDRATGLITIGNTSNYKTGGLLINKTNTGNALKIVDAFTGGTLYYGSAADTTSRVLSGDITGDSSQRIVVYADGKHEWGDGTATRDTNLYRSAASTLKTDTSMIVRGKLTINAPGAINTNIIYAETDGTVNGTLIKATADGTATVGISQIQAFSSAKRILDMRVTGDTVPRLKVNGDGSLGFGDGTLNDTNLYRAAAATLKTDSHLTAAGGFDTSSLTVSGATGTPVITHTKTDATTGSWAVGMSSGTTTSLAFIVKPTINALHTIQNQSGTNILSTDTANSRVGVLQASPTSAFHVQGSLATAVVSKTAAYTATITDSVILCSSSTAAFSITLPTAVGCPGREYTIKKTDTSANAVTVATTSSQTIDASTTYALSAQWSFVRVVSDNANWLIIGK